MRDGRASSTAQYVAVVRAILHRQGAIDDPYALAMLRPMMRAAVALSSVPVLRARTRSALYGALATRTLFFDAAVDAALGAGITQIVLVGAGYDSRAWRLARPGVRFFEVDHPATQRDKQERAPAAGGPVFVPVDLGRDAVVIALARAGFDPTMPAQFVIEGVTMYVVDDDVRSLLTALLEGAAGGSRLAVNFAPPPTSGDRRSGRRQRALRALGVARGEPHLSFLGASDARTFVAATGWRVDEVVRFRELATSIVSRTSLDLDGINPEACAVNAYKDERDGRRDHVPGGDDE